MYMIPTPQLTLLGLLRLKRPTATGLRRSLDDARAELGLGEGDALSPVCVAYALLKLRVQPEEVSRMLTWRSSKDWLVPCCAPPGSKCERTCT